MQSQDWSSAAHFAEGFKNASASSMDTAINEHGDILKPPPPISCLQLDGARQQKFDLIYQLYGNEALLLHAVFDV